MNKRIILVATIGAIISTASLLSCLQSKSLNNVPKAQTELGGIKLIDDKKEIKFKKGEPDKIDDSGSIWAYGKIDENDTADCAYAINFLNEKISEITCFSCKEKAYPILNGISKDSTLDFVKSVLGNRFEMKESKDSLTRTYYFPEYNQYFIMEKNKVNFFGIYNPKVLKK